MNKISSHIGSGASAQPVFFSGAFYTFQQSRRAWPSVASFHHVLRWSSSGADYLADAGGGILSLDFVPQGRAFAFVGDFLCHDDECFGFGDVADVDCSVSAACEQHQPFSEQLTMWPNNSPGTAADCAFGSAFAVDRMWRRGSAFVVRQSMTRACQKLISFVQFRRALLLWLDLVSICLEGGFRNICCTIPQSRPFT